MADYTFPSSPATVADALAYKGESGPTPTQFSYLAVLTAPFDTDITLAANSNSRIATQASRQVLR
jgi:hypothetical protein